MAATTRIGQGHGTAPAQPPRSMMPCIIQALSKRTPELAHAMVAIRNGQLGRDEAEQRLPGMSRLVGPDGHWHARQALEAAAREMAEAGDPQGVDRLVGNVTSLISSGRIGAAGASMRPTPPPAPAAAPQDAGKS